MSHIVAGEGRGVRCWGPLRCAALRTPLRSAPRTMIASHLLAYFFTELNHDQTQKVRGDAGRPRDKGGGEEKRGEKGRGGKAQRGEGEGRKRKAGKRGGRQERERRKKEKGGKKGGKN